MQNQKAAADRVTSRYQWYRDKFRSVASTNVMLSVIVCGLVSDRVYTAHHPPEPRYFFTDSKGNLIESTPLNRPVMRESEVARWTVSAILAAYNFDYVHYQAMLTEQALPNFTPEGWNNFVTSLSETHNLEEIKKKGIVVSAVPQGGPAMNKGVVIGGVLMWEVQFPALIDYGNLDDHREARVLMIVHVMRVPTTLNPEGIAIDSFVAKPCVGNICTGGG